jgi:hypothetical protein
MRLMRFRRKYLYICLQCGKRWKFWTEHGVKHFVHSPHLNHHHAKHFVKPVDITSRQEYIPGS